MSSTSGACATTTRAEPESSWFSAHGDAHGLLSLFLFPLIGNQLRWTVARMYLYCSLYLHPVMTASCWNLPATDPTWEFRPFNSIRSNASQLETQGGVFMSFQSAYWKIGETVEISMAGTLLKGMLQVHSTINGSKIVKETRALLPFVNVILYYWLALYS